MEFKRKNLPITRWKNEGRVPISSTFRHKGFYGQARVIDYPNMISPLEKEGIIYILRDDRYNYYMDKSFNLINHKDLQGSYKNELVDFAIPASIDQLGSWEEME